MFKLILIFVLGGNSSQSGISMSQAEYKFKTQEACEVAASYYRRPDVINYMDADDRNYRHTTVIARCWEDPKQKNASK